jgi:deazaflavin-dependent oxidoreductase (nitroreductase family)
MTRQPGKSAAFAAAGRILSRPSLRPVTRTFSNLHAALYRLTRGSAQNRKYPTMLLTVTGRRSGKAHTVPLIYIRDGERLVIAAAYAGSDTDPSWWCNLRAHPRAVAQVNRDIFTVEAELAKADERPDLWRRLVEMYPYFTDYQQRTSRTIPVVVLTPHRG